MMKYSNYIILFILLGIGVLFKDSIHVSTNLLSLFANKDSIEKLHIADQLGYSKEMLVVVKGFDNNSKTKVKEISKKLLKIKNIDSVISTVVPSKQVQKYYKDYYPLLATFNSQNQTKNMINKKLKDMYDAQFTNIFYSSIDKNDPLKLFNLQTTKLSNIKNRGEFITLGDYGYLIKVTTQVSPSQMNDAKELYKEVNLVIDKYSDVVAFAPFFYTVENSKKIQEDVKFIIIISTLALLLIYYLLIKNLRLLSHTIIALSSSMIFAGLISTLTFENFNILSLAFGMSITAVSIDYLLHYHFHNFYQNSKKIDKNVLYGFLTTTVAFGIFAFIPIPIIAQISFFAVASLSFAYIVFTFVFPKLDIKECIVDHQIGNTPKKVPAYIFFILSVMMFFYSVVNIEFDINIRNLDYQNSKLKEIEKLFKHSNNTKMYPVIVQADTKDKLIENLHLLHKKLPDSFSFASFVLDKNSCLTKGNSLKEYDFDRLNTLVNNEANSIGFKKDYFKLSYKFIEDFPECSIENLIIFKSYGLSLYIDTKENYTIALVSDTTKAKELNFIADIDTKKIFEKVANKMYGELVLFSSIVIILILVLFIFSVKRKYLYALNYIIFPLSFTLLILTSFYSVNIMHFFSLIILIAIGIDYGIYMSNTKKENSTVLAIRYSLLSTFSAFGVLIFSSITALNSIGIVICLGAVAIFTLIKVMR